jgi:hypothetical protein
MSMQGSDERGGGGGLVRDGATQTGRAVILIVVAVVVAVVLLHHDKPAEVSASTTTRNSSATTTPRSATTIASSATTTPSTVPATTTSTVPVADVKVLVLNGASFSEPLASEFTNQLKNKGYDTLTPNNASATVQSSAIYVITHGFTAEAEALASSLGLPPTAVKTQVPTGPPLNSGITGTGANLVLVVGPDLATSASSASSGSAGSSAATTTSTSTGT